MYEETALIGPTLATALTGTFTWNYLNAGLHKKRLKRGYLLPNAALTASDTNNRTAALAKGATAVITPIVTNVAQGNLVAGTPVELAVLQSAGVALELEPGEVHTFTLSHTGDGIAFNGQLALVYEEIQG